MARVSLMRGILLAATMGLVMPVLACSRCGKKQGPQNLAGAESPVIELYDPGTGCTLPGIPGPDMSIIYFDFDKSGIREDQLPRLEKNMRFLRESKDVKIFVEGHTDEQGTEEYNFALGEKRARAVAEYFFAAGIARERVRIVSKGEMVPAAAEHHEGAWVKNRRVEFLRWE